MIAICIMWWGYPLLVLRKWNAHVMASLHSLPFGIHHFSVCWQTRFVDWALTTPLLLMDLLFIAGVPFGTLLW